MTTSKSEQLSKEDEERLKNLFHKLDRNKDGRIDIEDLSAVLKSSSKSVASQTKVKFVTRTSVLSVTTLAIRTVHTNRRDHPG